MLNLFIKLIVIYAESAGSELWACIMVVVHDMVYLCCKSYWNWRTEFMSKWQDDTVYVLTDLHLVIILLQFDWLTLNSRSCLSCFVCSLLQWKKQVNYLYDYNFTYILYTIYIYNFACIQ